MKRTWFLRTLPVLLLVALGTPPPASAQPFDCPPDWGRRGFEECGGKCYSSGQFNTSNPCKFGGSSGAANSPPPQPEGDPDRRAAAQQLTSLLEQMPGNSAYKNHLIQDLNAQTVKSLGGRTSGGGDIGRLIAGLAGVGNCSRHFYNRTSDWWGVGLLNAGTCSVDGEEGSHFACLIPPHTNAKLEYTNGGGSVEPARIAISGGNDRYLRIFDMRLVGCHINHDGGTGAATLNDPAWGDVKAEW